MLAASSLLVRSLLALQGAGAPPTTAHSAPEPPPGVARHSRLFVEELPRLPDVLQYANHPWGSMLQPGAIIPFDPLSSAANAVRDKLATIGIHYSLSQAFTLGVLEDARQGDDVLGAYSFQLLGQWNMLDADLFGGTTGWISYEFIGGSGLGSDWGRQTVQLNGRTLVSPNNNAWGVDFAAEEVAWAQSFAAGELVVVAGLVNQESYLDLNRYANNPFGQLLNSAFVNNVVVPFTTNNLGASVQWQPLDWLYAMVGVGSNNQRLGTSPFDDVSFDNVSYLTEVGLVFDDVGGLGPGAYRAQPFLATAGGATGYGAGFNFEQQLGGESPLGAFGRLGAADETAASITGVRAGAAGGLALLSPFARHGLFSHDNADYAALGFSWAQATRVADQPIENEYALELTFVLQLTPTMSLQPDIQLIWNSAAEGGSDPEVVFQLQLNVQW